MRSLRVLFPSSLLLPDLCRDVDWSEELIPVSFDLDKRKQLADACTSGDTRSDNTILDVDREGMLSCELVRAAFLNSPSLDSDSFIGMGQYGRHRLCASLYAHQKLQHFAKLTDVQLFIYPNELVDYVFELSLLHPKT